MQFCDTIRLQICQVIITMLVVYFNEYFYIAT